MVSIVHLKKKFSSKMQDAFVFTQQKRIWYHWERAIRIMQDT